MIIRPVRTTAEAIKNDYLKLVRHPPRKTLDKYRLSHPAFRVNEDGKLRGLDQIVNRGKFGSFNDGTHVGEARVGRKQVFRLTIERV